MIAAYNGSATADDFEEVRLYEKEVRQITAITACDLKAQRPKWLLGIK